MNGVAVLCPRPGWMGQIDGEKLGEKRRQILETIRRNNQITIRELAELTGISATAVERNISKLKVKGLLRREGSDKGGHWEVTD